VRNVAEFCAQTSQEGAVFLKPRRGTALTLASRKEPTAPRSMHEGDEKLVPDF
jgi:hypothetical protein